MPTLKKDSRKSYPFLFLVFEINQHLQNQPGYCCLGWLVACQGFEGWLPEHLTVCPCCLAASESLAVVAGH